MMWRKLALALVTILIVALVGYDYLVAPILGLRQVNVLPARTFVLSGQDAQRLRDAHSLQEALAGYFKDHGDYPLPPVGTTCGTKYNNLGGLSDILVPKYIKSIPQDPSPLSCLYNYLYWSDARNYGILVHLDGIDPDKYIDHWCLGAAVGSLPSLETFSPCP